MTCATTTARGRNTATAWARPSRTPPAPCGARPDVTTLRYGSAAAVLAAVVAAAWLLAPLPDGGRSLALSVLLGAVFGIVLQRTRFCFYCIARDFIDKKETAGMFAVLLALGVGMLGYHAVFGAFLPIPSADRLPPGAHIGPVSVALVAGAFVFGVGMRISGSCISAHFYRLGEGALASPFALLGAGVGFVLGFASWNALYLALIQDAPVVWLPRHMGYGGSVLVQCGVLLALAWGLSRAGRRASSLRAAAKPSAQSA